MLGSRSNIAVADLIAVGNIGQRQARNVNKSTERRNDSPELKNLTWRAQNNLGLQEQKTENNSKDKFGKTQMFDGDRNIQNITQMNSKTFEDDKNEAILSAFKDNGNPIQEPEEAQQKPLIGVTSVKIKKSRSMKRNSEAVGQTVKQPTVKAISPNTGTRGLSIPVDTQRQSVFRRSFDGRQQHDYEVSKS